MKSFLFFCTSFLIGICLWIGLRVVLLDYVYMPERAMWLAKARMIDGYRYRQGDIVIIGSSRAMAINPELLRSNYNVNAVNFSVGGATTPSIYFFLKRVLKNNPGIKEVYLEFAPMNLTRKDTGLDASLGENFVRYVASAEEAVELDKDLQGTLAKYNAIHRIPFEQYFNMKDLSLLEGVIIRWRTGKSDASLIQQLVNSGGLFLYPDKGASLSGDKSKAFDKLADDGYKKQSEYTNNLPPVTVIYFHKIIELIKQQNINCTIFFSPVYKIGLNYKLLSFGDTYNLFKSTGSFVNGNILVLDKENFSEPSHVNKLGSVQYTKFFNDCIINDNCTNYSRINIFSVRENDAKK